MRNIPSCIHKYSRLACKNVMLSKINFLFRQADLLCEASAVVASCFATYSACAGGWMRSSLVMWRSHMSEIFRYHDAHLIFVYVCYISGWAVLCLEYPARFRRRVRMKMSALQWEIFWADCWRKAAIARKEKADFLYHQNLKHDRSKQYIRAQQSHLISSLSYSIASCIV